MSSRPLPESRDEKTLFLEALDIECAEERRAFLDEACGPDEALRRNVEDLLRIEDAGSSMVLDPSSYQALREGQESFVEFLEDEECFLENLGTEIRTLGDYELLEELGRGAMGIVFRARQRSLNREVAIKILVGSALASETERQRFRLEAEAAANLRHPNIVPVLEYGQIEEHDFFTMPVLPGGTLADRMEQGAMPPREAIGLMMKVTGGVQAAHDQGILHRDLKPQNVLFDEGGEPHVSDFGLACHLEQAGTLTLSGQIMGTPQYMAPEQTDGGSAPMTTAADIHSLGAILYELLAGVPPFRSDSVLKTLRMVKEQVPQSPRRLQPGIDRDLETITLKCLEKDPSKRYRSMGALCDDLSAWLENRPITARPPGPAERVIKWVRRHPVHAALAFTIGVVTLALGIGGPLLAVAQSKLREQAEAESARAERLRVEATKATARAEVEAERNRSLVYYAEMNRLGRAVAEPGTYPVIQELLEKWIPRPNGGKSDLRRWEWYLLAAFSEQSEQTVPLSPGAGAPRLHPNCHLYSVPAGTAVRIYSTTEPGLVRSLKEAPAPVTSTEWSPDGTYLAAASTDGSITLWEADSGVILRQVGNAHGGGATKVSWSPAGDRLATIGADGYVRTWNRDSLKELGSVKDPNKPRFRHGVSWSPSGNYVAFWQPNYFITVAADELSGPLQRINTRMGGPDSFAWHPDGDRIATGGDRGVILIWRVHEGGVNVVKSLTGHVGAVLSLAWSPDGTRLASGSDGRELKIWDVEKGVTVDEFPGQFGPVLHLDWGTDNRTLLSSDGTGVVRTWRLDRNRVPQVLHDFQQPLIAACLDPSGDILAGVGHDRTLSLIDLQTGEERQGLSNQPGLGKVISWRPDSQRFAFRMRSRDVGVLDPESGAKAEIKAEAATPVVSTGWNADRREFLTAHHEAGIRIWDWSGQRLLRTLPAHLRHGPVSHASWSPDGARILCSTDQGWLSLWPAEGGEPKEVHAAHISGEFLKPHAWQPTGTHFATGTVNGVIRLWNAQTLREERVLKGHTGTVLHLAWHPDGTRLASSSADRTIKIWDPATGEVVLTLRGHDTEVTSVQWSSGGKALVSVDAEGTVLSWDASRAYESFLANAPEERE